MKPTLLLTSALCLVAMAPAQSAIRPNSSAEETIVVTGRAPQQNLDFQSATGSRLGLSNRETPAIVDVLTQADFQTQGLNNAICPSSKILGQSGSRNSGEFGLFVG